MREDVLEELRQLSEEDYKAFNCKLIPGINKERVLGVRVPAIRKLARKVCRQQWQAYLGELESCAEDGEGIGGTELFYEEIMLQAMVIAAARMESKERLEYIGRFVPRIDNWAVCDTFCGGLKFAGQEENRELVWQYLQQYLDSEGEYSVRFGVVMLLCHYIDETYIARVLEKLEAIRCQGYYVKMAVAWALSICYVGFPEQTETVIRNNGLDDFTHNKAIQKIRESYRVPKEEKERLQQLKRK